MKQMIFVSVIIMLLISCTLGSMSDEENLGLLVRHHSGTFLSNYYLGSEDGDDKLPINSFLWYRTKRDTITKNLEIDIVENSAIVTVSNIIPGYLNVSYINDSLDTVKLQKEFTDTIVRYISCRKDTLKNHFGGWRVVSLSSGLVQGDSAVSIDSVKLISRAVSDTIIINDPLEMYPKDDLLRFTAGDSVTVRVYSGSEAYHYIHHEGKRAKLNSREQTFPVTFYSGYSRVSLDILSKESIDDNEAEYNSELWVIPVYIEQK